MHKKNSAPWPVGFAVGIARLLQHAKIKQWNLSQQEVEEQAYDHIHRCRKTIWQDPTPIHNNHSCTTNNTSQQTGNRGGSSPRQGAFTTHHTPVKTGQIRALAMLTARGGMGTLTDFRRKSETVRPLWRLEISQKSKHSFKNNPHPRACLLILGTGTRRGEGRGGTERKREKNSNQLIPRHIWPGIEPATFWCTVDAPTNWASWPRLNTVFTYNPAIMFPGICPLALETYVHKPPANYSVQQLYS